MATSRLCSVPNCDKPHYGKGWCIAHYSRWYRHGDPLKGGTTRGDPMRYFEETVLLYDGAECLRWPFSTGSHGYGNLYVEGETKLVHRLVCERTHGKPPTPKHEASHSCGNGHEGCCAPSHLVWKTPAENNADKINHKTNLRGEQCYNAKLTSTAVKEIRRLAGGGLLHREIAAMFNMHPHSIGSIVRRQTWAWLHD